MLRRLLRRLLRGPAGRTFGRSLAVVRYSGTRTARALGQPADPSPGDVAGAAQRAVLVRFDIDPEDPDDP